jgi:phosphopantothenoylcysteine decarboxylase/phosphopantothenate--cysteine ligase
VLVVAPLTANTMARLAHGLADDLLTETALAHRGPVLLAPAMNTAMWEHPATQANLALLVERGAEVVGPDDGELAEGLVGTGRMAEPVEIVRRVEGLLEGRSRTARSRDARCSSPREARASRSTASASSGTARRAAWASPSPTWHGSAART